MDAIKDNRLELGRRNNDDSSSSRESSPVRKTKRSFSPTSDDEVVIEPIADDDTPPPEGPLIRQAVAFPWNPSSTSVVKPSLGLYQPTPAPAPNKFLPGQEVPVPPPPPKPAKPRKTKKKAEPRSYSSQTNRFRVTSYDPTPVEKPALTMGEGPYASLYRASHMGSQDANANEKNEVSQDQQVIEQPVEETSATDPTPVASTSKAKTTASKGKSKDTSAKGKVSKPKKSESSTPGPSNPVSDAAEQPEAGPSRETYYRRDYDASLDDSGQSFVGNSPHGRSMQVSQRTRSDLRLVTLLIEERRGAVRDDQLAEVRVPLRDSENIELDGYWAKAEDICRHLQASPSRIDGPAKVYVLRGKYKQIVLKVTADNKDEYVDANVVVTNLRTVEVIVEHVLPPPPVPVRMYPPQESWPPPEPAHYYPPQGNPYPSYTAEHPVHHRQQNSRKRRHSPMDDERDRFTTRQWTPSTLDSSPRDDRTPSRPSTSYPQHAFNPGVPDPRMHVPEHYPTSRHAGSSRNNRSRSIESISSSSEDMEAMHERVTREVDQIIQQEDTWDQFFRWHGKPRSVLVMLKEYQIVQGFVDKWVGKQTPSGARIEKSHIGQALSIGDGDPAERDKYMSDCAETTQLLAQYGPEGTRLQDPEVKERTLDDSQPGYNAKPVRGLLRASEPIRKTSSAQPLELQEMSNRAGPSQSVHDYTEGASAIDIDSAAANNRRSRRDSQYSALYAENGDGSMFSGPAHSAMFNPSSVSRMAHIEPSRRSTSSWSRSRRRSMDSSGSTRRPLSRRSTEDSQFSAQSPDVEQDTDIEEDYLTESRRQTTSSTPPLARSGVFESIASLFTSAPQAAEAVPRRRPSFRSSGSAGRYSRRSRHSDVGSEHALDLENEDGEERWGYSSGEEDFSDESESGRSMATNMSVPASMDYDSEPPSPNTGQGLPLLASDQVFGHETRIDMDMSLAFLDTPPPPGPPSRQILYIPDEDANIRFVGYETIWWREIVWRVCCVATLGALGLLGHWFPQFWLRWVAREKAFQDASNGFVVIESAHRDITLFRIQSLDYPYPVSTVFPASADAPQSASTIGTLLVVDYRYSRFALDPRTGLFTMIRDWRDHSWSGTQFVQSGMETAARQQRLTLFGKNEVDINGKSIVSLLVDEVIHPFYVFQIASILLWSLDDYYYYAFCIFFISVFSISTTLIETKRTISRMREMSRFSCDVDVLVDGLWVTRDSAQLVPGDLVNISTSQMSLIAADMFLLSGDAIVNESMLTGESVPVSKAPAKDEDLVRWRDMKGEASKSFLYAGTRVVRIRGTFTVDGGPGQPALALVVRTGFNTTKGALIRSMLYPKPIGFKFYRDSVRFIGVLAGIAGIGFCFSAVQFVRLGVKWHTIVIRALDLITVVVPPALPATLSIGTSFAIARLRKHGIFCISPSRVNVGGKVNVCCFDKTGTLTEDGLDILGVRAPDRNVQRFGELLDDVRDLPLGNEKATFLHALATCHSLKMVDGTIIGDPLDAKMFEFTRWMLEEGRVAGTGVIKAKSGTVLEQTALVQTVVRPPGSAQFKLEDALKGAAKHAHFLELGVIRTFEFVSALRRMSVVVKRLRSSSMEIYVKGAPEVMTEICDRESLPHDYDDLLSYYTKRGYRVIAIAGKSIEGLSWLKAQRMKREQAESGLRFLGLIIFENKLKPGTAPAIHALRSAHLACRMITGDNPLTAVSVARECGLINPAAHVFSPMFIRGNENSPNAALEWSCMDEFAWKLDMYTLKPLTPPQHSSEIDYQDYALVVTGDVFRWLINHAPLETLQRMLVKTQIFARMSPDEKNEVVERLQSLGYTVLMCGDGANDCAALKAADVGISLSEAEASVAAPFTSSTPDIGCVIEVIKEGRAALVTSFSCFKYMALYSMIQFTSVTLLYSFASSLGDFQFLYIDLFIIIPVAVAMGRTLPYPRIHTKRPTASLVSKKVLASLVGQIVITSSVQLWGYLWVRNQPWYTPPPASDPESDGNRLESTNYENSTLFLLSCFQYVLVAAVFSIGPPYRKSMWTNGWLMGSLLLLTALNTLVLLAPPEVVSDLLTLMPLPNHGRSVLLFGAVVNAVLCMCFEQWGAGTVAVIAGRIGKVMHGWRGRRWDGKKVYKAVEGGMGG
ncbi:cation-transporting ATPase [Favolaschia claudopus]|uniref:Cation-transporting ATPase n=1 Tax=Favolaschia claudopus TaxID=2862362 RepID=A0AAW0A8X5_9AGAR